MNLVASLSQSYVPHCSDKLAIVYLSLQLGGIFVAGFKAMLMALLAMRTPLVELCLCENDS